MKKYIDPKTVNIVDLVRDNKKVRFSFFRENEFFYEHEDGLVFPISLKEAQSGKATFLAEDKAIYFMRWMKRFIDQSKLIEKCSVSLPTQEELIDISKKADIQ